MVEVDRLAAARGEPWGTRLWLAALVAIIVAACLQSYGITSWPMADDEVPSLVEMGLADVPAQAFSVPASQIGRLPRATPVWYRFQRFAIDHLTQDQLGYRLPSVVFGVITSALMFVMAARWRGLWFASALALMMNTSQLFVYLVQLDRFYSLPFLLMLVALLLVWTPAPDVYVVPIIAVVTALAVLSHNITVPIFGLAFAAACVLFVLGRVSFAVLLRSGAAALVAVLLYGLYLLPIVRGWASTGNPTPVLISFAAQMGVPILALALFGLWLVAAEPTPAPIMWASLVFVASAVLLQFTNMSWNPRYFLFFLPAAWLLAAHTVERLASRLRYGWTGVAWYGCVAVLCAPNLVSHYIDGSRHDYRQAANVLIAHDQDETPILSDDAETISYYLPADLRHHLFVRTKIPQPPPTGYFLVTRANAWTPLPTFPGRHAELLAEIYRRRVDQFSHILRVYRVAPAAAP